MVAKINIGNSLYGALAYNQEKVDENLGKVLGANLVNEPLDGRFHISDCMEDFMQFVPGKYRTEKLVFHVSLNPHPDDKLSDDQLADIGREYMEKLGYGNQPYIIFKHEDIDRQHLHIVSLRVDANGKKINDSKEYIRSKKITEEIEQKYNLNPAEGQKNKEIWQFTPVDISKGNLKKQMASVIKPVAAMYHYQTMGEYKAALSFYKIHVEELKGEVKGKPYRGLLYFAMDSEKNKTGTPLKSSIFGRQVGYEGVEKRMGQSAELIKTKNLKESTLKAVSEAKANCGSESEFRAELKKQGIDVLFRRNADNRIYGVTFIDHSTRTVLNGSRLGKEFSANVFNELFNNQQEIIEEFKNENPFPETGHKENNSPEQTEQTEEIENSEQTEQNRHSNQHETQYIGNRNENRDNNDNNSGNLFSAIIPEPTFNSDDNNPFSHDAGKRKRENSEGKYNEKNSHLFKNGKCISILFTSGNIRQYSIFKSSYNPSN